MLNRLDRWICRHRSWLVAVSVILVFAFSLFLNLNKIPTSVFHPDESRWINRAHYLPDLATPLGDDWSDRYLLRGQPPVGSYITGLGLILQGRDTETNAPYNFHYGNEAYVTWEAGHNAMPTLADLVAARRTNAVIGALSSALLVLVLSRVTSLFGALAGGAVLAVNDLHEYLSSTALSDASLGLILLLATLLAMQLAARPGWRRTILFGIALGFGMASKLSPFVLSLGFALVGVLFLLRPALACLPGVGRPVRILTHGQESQLGRLGWMLLSLPFITCATFVALYPFVWSAPLTRTKILFDFRSWEMRNQAAIWPYLKVDGTLDALVILSQAFQHHYSSSRKLLDFLVWHTPLPDGLPRVDVALALIGFFVLVIAIIRTGFATPLAFSTLVLGGQAAIIVLGMRVNYDRYYLPVLLLGAFCIGYLFGEIAQWLGPRSPAGTNAEDSALSSQKRNLEAMR